MMPDAGKIAVVGASKERSKFGNKCVRAYVEAGWRVYPVHPVEHEIEGLEAYPDIARVPVELDRISVYLSPRVSAKLLPAFAEKGAGEVWFNPGSADAEVLDRARELGISVKDACSIVDLGVSPARYP
jgi:predicted CoA-binding protein